MSSPVPTIAQRAMNSQFVATVYEQLGDRPPSTLPVMSPPGPSSDGAAAALHLSNAQSLLDRMLPFDNETFDAVCCFGALYLMPDPLRVAREMVRVPGRPDRDPDQKCRPRGPDLVRPDHYCTRDRARDVRPTHLCRSAFVGRPARRRTTDAARAAVHHRRKARLKTTPAPPERPMTQPCRRPGNFWVHIKLRAELLAGASRELR
jgi:SAM-dependent methyltransferase